MKRWRSSKLGRIALLGVFLMMSIPFSGIAVAEETHPLVDPILISSPTYGANWNLMDPPVECDADRYYKFDNLPSQAGTYSVTIEVPTCDGEDVGDVTVNMEVYGPGNNMVRFEIIGGKTGAVYVKGGAGPEQQHGNLYWYADDPQYPQGVSEDWDLETPNGTAVSHVEFCLCADDRIQKDWEFTAPDAFADEDYDYKAYYSEIDPDDPEFVDWIAVDLADDNGVFKGTTYHDEDTTLWFKWLVYDGMDVVFESDVLGPETLEAPGPYTNDFQLCLKAWLWSPPELLTTLFDTLELSAFYALEDPDEAENGVDWTEVVLEEDENGDFYAETLFECGTEIWYYFEVSGFFMDVQYYFIATAVGSEVITGPSTVENVFVAPRTLKTFELTACVEPAGGTYYAAWSITGEEPWYEVELEPVPGEDCVYSGEVELFEGMEIYWKFYDAEWSTVVLGPETLEGATMVNRWERADGVTRTIGYWQTHPCMTELVFDSIGGEIDICWTTLESIEEVMAVLNWPQMSGAPRLSAYHKAVLQTSRQLVAATLNEGLGSTMPMYNGMSAKDAFCAAIAAEDLATIIAIGEVLDEFNNSGTEEWLPEWTWECWVAADPILARQLGAAGWDAVRSNLP